MDQIEKFVKKLSKKLAKRIKQALLDIVLLNLINYDIEKLKGQEGLYRIRIGKIRITFQKFKEYGQPIDIDYRGGVYKKLK